MYTLIKKIAVAAVIAISAQAAVAAEYQVTVQGQLAKDIFATSFFGITDPSVPVQISFKVNDAGVVKLNAGTPVNISSGASFNSVANLVPKTSISEFVASIGSASFTEDDLALQALGTSSNQYDVLLLGDLTAGGISSVQFNLSNASGNLQFGVVNCVAACSIINVGDGNSNIEGSVAEISGIQVTIENLTPPPSAQDLIGELITSIKNNSGIKPLQKLVFQIELGVTSSLLKKGKTLQAEKAMKAFVVTVKALVKANRLSVAIGDQLLADAQEIIDAI
jgi:hypothetical protein